MMGPFDAIFGVSCVGAAAAVLLGVVSCTMGTGDDPLNLALRRCELSMADAAKTEQSFVQESKCRAEILAIFREVTRDIQVR